MKKKLGVALGIIYILLILVIFKAWFLPGVITGGDMSYFFPSMYDNFQIHPSDWAFFAGNGFGGTAIPHMPIIFIISILFFFGKTFSLSWDMLLRIFILFPFLICSTLFPYLLFKKLFPENPFAIISSFLFTLNTYVLMLVSGGLVIIGIAYALIPLSFLFVFNILESTDRNKKVLIFQILSLGLAFGIQSILDVRVTYMTVIGVGIYLLSLLFINKEYFIALKKFIFILVIPLLICGLINSFWIIPALLYGSNPLEQLGDNYTTVESVRFFSFAKFENTISLLHPNWPENIFGKTYFQRPEFLLFSILAFLSLLFVGKYNKKIILPVVIIGIIGAFLAKGANEPFGQIYIFLFENVPGFVFYRDPTKWYMLIALSFAILIPFTLFELYKKYRKVALFIPVLFVVYFLITIFPALLGNLSGTLQTSEVPEEYAKFEEFMLQQKPGRVLWVPSPSRFSYYSEKHPAVYGNKYFNINKPSEIAGRLNTETIKRLAEKSVKYIAIPYDNRGEIFLEDRVYDNEEYLRTVDNVDNNIELQKIGNFGNLKLYKIENGVELDLQFNSNKNRSKAVDLGVTISLVTLVLVTMAFLILKLKK